MTTPPTLPERSARYAPLRDLHPCYLGGQPHEADAFLEVRDKWTDEAATRVVKADANVLDRAIALAHEARGPMRRLPAHHRRRVLDELVDRCRARREELATLLCIEAGKPRQHASGEVDRLIDTLRIAAEESVRIGGEVLDLDRTERAEGRRGLWRRVPAGVVGCITPWNFPLNLVAHKIGPAIACGCPFVLKPASATPLGALALGEMLHDIDLLPAGAFSILPMDSSDADALVEDERIARLSFTGSAEVGWDMKRRCGRKRITLELGGNAPLVVERDADVEDAIERAVFGAFYQSGQSCIGVQRILVHDDVYERFRDGFVERARELPTGDPMNLDVFVGPIIDEEAAERIEQWIAEADRAGGRILCGGTREGTMVAPTVIEEPRPDTRAETEEIFGPVAVLHRYRDFDDAIAQANDTRYGLQAGVFTKDIDRIEQASDELEYGGVVINDVPSWRVDSMPYGGVKDSGLGREGIRWAIEEMTEPRLLVIRSTRRN